MLYYFFDINRAQENRPLFEGCRIEQAGGIKSLLKKTTLKKEKELKSLLQGAEVRAKIDEGIIQCH